jgi:hypothetical protein
MEFNLADPTTLGALIQFTETGATAGCPFCKGRMIASVSPGDRIIILKGMNVGREATVSRDPGFSDDEFLVKFDSDPPTRELLTSWTYLLTCRSVKCQTGYVVYQSMICAVSIIQS